MQWSFRWLASEMNTVAWSRARYSCATSPEAVSTASVEAAPNVSKAYVRVEIEAGGTGVCYDGDSGLGFCTGTGNTQICKLH